MNLFSLAKAFPTEEAAIEYWIQARWPNGVRCLACDHTKVYRIETKGKTGKPCLLFECADCGLHFSPTTGTLFHDSHLPMQKWFAAIALMVEAKKGISAKQVARHIGITYKTAWYLCHRIRQAMQEENDLVLGGETKTVEIDETYIGGRQMHKGNPQARANKTMVLGMAERSGRLHLQTIKKATAANVKPILDSRLSPQSAKVVTDGSVLYRGLIPKEQHEVGVHVQEKFTGHLSNQTVENAFSLFKRGIVGNYHKLSEDHLDRYLGEFCWRYNRRYKQVKMFDMALANLGKKQPMPYQVLIGRDKE